MPAAETIIEHTGAISFETMETLLMQLRCSKEFLVMNKITRKRLYSTVVESMDNMLKYAASQAPENGGVKSAPMIAVKKQGNQVVVISGNLVMNDDIADLRFKLDRVNQLDNEALKSLYEDIINQEAGENDKGAGLGLITMALRTKNDISYSFTSLDGDQSFFKMQIIING